MPAALSPSLSRLRPAYAVAGPALLLALLALTQLADQRAVFDPPWLLTTLNLVFLTAVPLAGAALAVPAYRRAGAGAVLALGAGLLTLGVGCGVVPAVLRFGVDANASVSLHNISMLLAGALQFVAALAAVFGTWLGSRRGLHVVVVYLAVLAAVGVTLVAVAAGALPTFWVVDSGGTQVRAVVLRAAVVLWVGSALLWLPAAARDRGVPFLDWYIGGLLLLGLSLVALVGQQQAGNASSWAARAGQYAGAATMVATLVLALRPRTGRGSTPDLGLALVQATLPFRPIVESASDGVLVVRGDGRVMYANDKARSLLGWEAVDPIEASVETLLPASMPAPDRAALLASLAGTAAEPLVGPVALGGAHAVVELSFLGAPGASARVCLLRDVTERERARDELEARVEERTAELVRANAAKDEFLGLVSHELRTPITTIVGLGALLERRIGDHDPDGLLADLTADAARLARIVDNLLVLARLEAGRSPEWEPVELGRLATQVVHSVRAEFRGRAIELEADPGLVVEANPDQLAMVVRNYVVNALKYSGPDQPVAVRVRRAGESACLDVIDQGPGIVEADPMALFEPFYRSPSTSATPGVGIGLTVCKRIVESFGGEVAAASRDDERGAVFSFVLPLMSDEEYVPAEREPEVASAGA